MSDYTAANIVILDKKSLREKFFFRRVKQLSDQYPNVASSFIARMLETCLLSGFSQELAIKRYLAFDKSVVPSPEFIECHKELLQEFRANKPNIH